MVRPLPAALLQPPTRMPAEAPVEVAAPQVPQQPLTTLPAQQPTQERHERAGLHLPINLSLDASGIEAALIRHRQEVLSMLTTLRSEIMSGTQDLRARFDAEFQRLADEVRETRSASEAMGTALSGLRDQLNAAMEQMRANGVREEDIAALKALGDSLDGVQADMANAAGENVDGGQPAQPEPAPVEPAPVEPAQPEPVPVEPAPEPAPVDPAPVPQDPSLAPVGGPPADAVSPPNTGPDTAVNGQPAPQPDATNELPNLDENGNPIR